jgi:N-methylhydantoinase B
MDSLGAENLEPGDVVICTVPAITGSHAADGVLFTPIFYRGKIFGYAATKTHWHDLGAKSFYPMDTRTYYEEGLHIPPVRFYKKGILQRELWETIKWNSRAPDLVWGDMQAQIAGCRFAEKRVNELLDKYGLDTVKACIDEMYDYGEKMTRLAIEGIHDGTWTAEDYLDDNGIELNKPVKLKVTITVKGSDITIDFTGSAPEQKGPLNGPLVATITAVRITVKALTTPWLPANEGCFRPIKVIVPERSVLNPSPTAPTFLWSWTAHNCLELINKALQHAMSDKIPACSGADPCLQGFSGVHADSGEYWGTIIPANIGQGADKNSDGEHYLFHHAGGSPKNTPIEVMESLYPLFIDDAGLVTDSGGPGRHRGGVGFRISYHPLEPVTFFSMIERAKTPLWGVDGGREGVRNNLQIHFHDGKEMTVLKTSGIELGKSDKITGTAGGGCGYGDPLERDPEEVRQDVINGYVSIERAQLDYGVVIRLPGFEIDAKSTNSLQSRSKTGK